MDDDLRIDAVQSMVGGWSPSDQRGRESKKRFEEYLKNAEESADEEDDSPPLEVTTSAVVLGPEGTLLHTYDFMPQWNLPGGRVANHEAPWDVVKRETEQQTGVAADHPKAGPRLVHVEVEHADDGSTHLDLRFMLFANVDSVNTQPAKGNTVKWFKDDEVKEATKESFHHALQVAHALRDEALR